MALPITPPYTFANATVTQNLSYLDSDFATVYNAVNGIGNGTVALSNVSITGGTISANVSATSIHNGTSNVSVDSSNGPVSINTAGTNAMYIDSSQNVGIGTSSPGVKLDVVGGSIKAHQGYYVGVARSDNSLVSYISNVADNETQWRSDGGGSFSTFYTAGSERMRIDSSGNLLVGKTSQSATTVGFEALPSGQVDAAMASAVSAQATLNVYSTGASAYRFYVDMSGVIHATSTSIAAISDASLKTNIKPLETGLSEIMALQPRRFDWADQDKTQGTNIAGFIAQEVQEVLPDLVAPFKYNNEETKLGLKMGDMIPTLVKAIQELKATVDAQAAEITALKAKVGA